MPVFTRTDRWVTGLSGLLAGALSVGMVALYFVYSGPPPLANVIGRNLITLATFTGFIVFAVGLHRLLRSRTGDAGLAGTLAVTTLLVYVTVTLVSTSLEVGASLSVPNGAVDPTLDGPLAAAMVLLHGPIARVLIAVYLLALTAATVRGRVLPRGVNVGNVVLAVVNLLLVPSIYFGMNSSYVYAANGWGSVASIGAINMIWFAVLGAAVLTRRPAPATAARPVRTPVSAHVGA